MALQDILEEIKKQAEKEVAELEADTRATIEKIVAEYAEKRNTQSLDMETKIKDNVSKVKSRAETFAKMEMRSNLLRAKRELLQKIFDNTVDQLIHSDNYVEILVALLKKAAKAFSEGAIISAKGKESDTRTALEQSGTPFRLSEQSATIRGGFILTSGHVEVNFSFESILEKELWDKLEVQLNQLLFSH